MWFNNGKAMAIAQGKIIERFGDCYRDYMKLVKAIYIAI